MIPFSFASSRLSLSRLRSMAAVAASLAVLGAMPAFAKGGVEGGCSTTGFSISAAVSGGAISGNSVPGTITVSGKYISFRIDTSTFAVQDYTLQGGKTAEYMTANPLVIYSSKTPNLRGAVLTGDIAVGNDEGSLTLQRTGGGVSVSLQAKDCATGGLFQMEVERADGTPTDYTHVLGPNVFYFNNPRFSPPPPLPLCPAGGPYTPSCTPVPITPRVNIASDVAPLFVGRDSPQDATRLTQTGGTTTWRVLSGGRLGGVIGEDAVEVAPPATPCASHCKAQNQVKGKYPVLGFPSPVPANSMILPR